MKIILLEANFLSFDHSQTLPGVKWGPTQNYGPIGSAVLTFIGYKETGMDTQADKQSI